MRFLVYMYYTHSCYQTSIFGKNCAYYIRIFTVMSLLIDLTSAPDDNDIGIEYCQKVSDKELPVPISIPVLHMKSITNTRHYSMQYSKSIMDTIRSNTSTMILIIF